MFLLFLYVQRRDSVHVTLSHSNNIFPSQYQNSIRIQACTIISDAPQHDFSCGQKYLPSRFDFAFRTDCVTKISSVQNIIPLEPIIVYFQPNLFIYFLSINGGLFVIFEINRYFVTYLNMKIPATLNNNVYSLTCTK